MRLSIVIPVFNKISFTRSCLKDLEQLPSDHEIIVIDNGSSDETQEELSKNKRIVYNRLDINKGFGFACNTGYQLATAPNVLFLNNDIRVKSNHTNWTEELIKYCPYAMVGPTMGQLDNKLNFVKEADKVLTGNSYMSGWCLASSKEIWKKLDLSENEIFSKEYFCYFEDTDLSFRARKLGIKMEVVQIPVVHFGKQTSKLLNTHQLYTDARKIFVKKWLGKCLKI